MPTLNEQGYYTVNMPFVPNDRKDPGKKGDDYGGSKHIRVAQPSGGMSGGKPYGLHFPSKRGAEMVLAFVDGNPDRPVGLGFVPNMASPSVANAYNYTENVMRSWGGNELIMNDTRQKESVKLSTPTGQFAELHDGNGQVRVKSKNSELLFDDREQYAGIDAGGHTLHIDYTDDNGKISIKTVNGIEIEMTDPDNRITLQTAAKDGDTAVNTVVLDGKDQSVTIDSNGNAMILNGQDSLITLESEDSKFAVDGQNSRISLESGDGNGIILDGDTITISAKKEINLKAGGKIIFDAKMGVVNKGRARDMGQGNAAGGAAGGAGRAETEQKTTKSKDNAAATPVAIDAKPTDRTDVNVETPNTSFHNNEVPTRESLTHGGDDEILEDDQIVRIYLSYGNDFTKLESKDADNIWKTKYYNDLNVHVETKTGNDGKTVNITVKYGGKEFELHGIVSKNNVVFEKAFEEFV
jgi:hypothetical protein